MSKHNRSYSHLSTYLLENILTCITTANYRTSFTLLIRLSITGLAYTLSLSLKFMTFPEQEAGLGVKDSTPAIYWFLATAPAGAMRQVVEEIVSLSLKSMTFTGSLIWQYPEKEDGLGTKDPTSPTCRVLVTAPVEVMRWVVKEIAQPAFTFVMVREEVGLLGLLGSSLSMLLESWLSILLLGMITTLPALYTFLYRVQASSNMWYLSCHAPEMLSVRHLTSSLSGRRK